MDADIAGIAQTRRRAAGAYQPGVPEPPVDALAVFGRHSAALLGVGLELRLQGGELGKGRIRIGRFFTLAALESRRPGRPLLIPIPFARRPVESLLGFLTPMV